jgi:hypothetical protein
VKINGPIFPSALLPFPVLLLNTSSGCDLQLQVIFGAPSAGLARVGAIETVLELKGWRNRESASTFSTKGGSLGKYWETIESGRPPDGMAGLPGKAN